MTDIRFLDPITVLSTIGGISIDITERLAEDYTHIITENPIEDGSPTTDHITNLQPKIQIRGGFSDFRISSLVGPAVTQDAIKGRSKTEFDRLLDLFLSRDTFKVMDGLHLFKDMQFKNLRMIKEQEEFSVMFEAEIWNIRKVYVGGVSTARITSESDAQSRFIAAPQLLSTVGAVSTGEFISERLASIGVLL